MVRLILLHRAEGNEFLGNWMLEEEASKARDFGSCCKLPDTSKFTNAPDPIKSKSAFANDWADPRQLVSVWQ
jgi:hypothetical protein